MWPLEGQQNVSGMLEFQSGITERETERERERDREREETEKEETERELRASEMLEFQLGIV